MTGLTNEAIALLQLLTEIYPATFKHECDQPLALKVGVHIDLALELDGLADASVIAEALRIYTARPLYGQCLRPGAHRVDLKGQPSGIVDPQHFWQSQNARRWVRPPVPEHANKAAMSASEEL